MPMVTAWISFADGWLPETSSAAGTLGLTIGELAGSEPFGNHR